MYNFHQYQEDQYIDIVQCACCLCCCVFIDYIGLILFSIIIKFDVETQ